MSLKNEEKTKISVVKSGQKIQIGLPSLCNYDDDDEDEEEEIKPKSTLKNLNPTIVDQKTSEKPRSGLLGILPPPKSTQNQFIKKPTTLPAPVNEKESTSKLFQMPTTEKSALPTTSSQVLLPRHMMGKFPVKIVDQEVDDIPSAKKYTKLGTEQKTEKAQNLPVYVETEDPEPFVKESNEDEDDDDETTAPETENLSRNQVLEPTNLSQDAMIRLLGAQGKKRKMDDIQFTEVSADAIVGDNKADLLKQVTSEYKPPSNKDYFSTSSRRTHHVTYLAKVALERDQELRNTWAQGKFNKKQAREKYGF